jgi:2-polyprenyl-3-methyl-5-hydroxy-6-metoxy-1,4-benzoquinol methylase
VARLGLGERLRAKTRAWSRDSDTVRRWREGRYRVFIELCAVEPREMILDVGAGRGSGLERFNRENPIVAVDIDPQVRDWLDAPNVTLQFGDALDLPFSEGEFPVAFSNSVIEHIPKDKQQQFAAEIRRVSSRYFVQTPNRWFPIEPHYQLPLFQFLPERVQRALNARFTIGWVAKGHWSEINLLSAGELKRLFPDAEIHREKVLGLTKSLMAVRRPRPETNL